MEERHSGHRRQEVPVHRFLVHDHRGEHREACAGHNHAHRRQAGRRQGLRQAASARPPKLEVWNYGTVAERVAAADSRWTWKGNWRAGSGNEAQIRTASEKGAEASIKFKGTGAIVVGPYLREGGKADVYLDGKLDRTVDVYSDERGSKENEAVWHAFGLKNGKHTVRLVVRGEPYASNKGMNVAVTDLVIFR